MKCRYRKYQCPKCGKVILRRGTTKTLRGFCEDTGTNVIVRLCPEGLTNG